MASPHRPAVVLTAAGLALGAVVGWLAGLLRGPARGLRGDGVV